MAAAAACITGRKRPSSPLDATVADTKRRHGHDASAADGAALVALSSSEEEATKQRQRQRLEALQRVESFCMFRLVNGKHRQDGVWLAPLRTAAEAGTDADADTLHTAWEAALNRCRSCNVPVNKKDVIDVIELFKAFGLEFHTLVHNAGGLVLTRFYEAVCAGKAVVRAAVFECVPFADGDYTAPAELIDGRWPMFYPLALSSNPMTFYDDCGGAVSRVRFRQILEKCSVLMRNQTLNGQGVLDHLTREHLPFTRDMVRDIVAVSGRDGSGMELKVTTLARLGCVLTQFNNPDQRCTAVQWAVQYLDLSAAMFRVSARAIIHAMLPEARSEFAVPLCELVWDYAWPSVAEAGCALTTTDAQTSLQLARTTLDEKVVQLRVTYVDAYQIDTGRISLMMRVREVLDELVSHWNLPTGPGLRYQLMLSGGNGTPLNETRTLYECDVDTYSEFTAKPADAVTAAAVGSAIEQSAGTRRRLSYES